MTDQVSGFRAEKLSGTVEELGLDRRAYHTLKRAGIHHISTIIVRGEVGILALKNMGPVTANRVFSAIAKHISIPREELFSEEIIHAAMSYEERPSSPLDTPITVPDLSLSVSTIKSLIDQVNTEWASAKPVTEPPTINLGVILPILLRDERTSRIIELRANRLLTLEEIAVEIGCLTRERIRQIIDQMTERIRKNLNRLMVFCDYFEKKVESPSENLKSGYLTISALVDQLKLQLPDSNLIATEKELEMLITIVRLLVVCEKPWSEDILQKRWKKIAYLACLANPPIEKHATVHQLLKRQKEKAKKASYKELALLILSDEKRPMHWSEIADRAYHMGRRDSFSTTALYNSLMSHPDLFVRVDAGTYALVDWGLNQVDTYPDIIASIMKSHKKALPAETIHRKVNEIRPVKQATLTMLLELHPRFYKSLEKTYGLRVWLPPREKQTLRTPEWLVEDSDSYGRLEHASQRGYDVESIIRVDSD